MARSKSKSDAEPSVTATDGSTNPTGPDSDAVSREELQAIADRLVTKTELQDVARRMGIAGRSKMDPDELAAAIQIESGLTGAQPYVRQPGEIPYEIDGRPVSHHEYAEWRVQQDKARAQAEWEALVAEQNQAADATDAALANAVAESASNVGPTGGFDAAASAAAAEAENRAAGR